jgi:polyhydroxybutyrate depolymerase
MVGAGLHTSLTNLADDEGMRRILALGAAGGFVLALVVLQGEPVAAGTTQVRTMQSGGLTRTYRVYRPTGLTGRVPVVMMLHGGFGTGQQAQRAYGWDQKADAGRFLVVYPDGVSNTWNAGTCCGAAMRGNVNDVAFLGALLNRVVASDGGDASRLYVTGMSNGAMMAYRLACELPNKLAAIGPVAGAMTVPCTAATPTSVLHIHGLADNHVPYEGGVGTEGFAKDPRPSIPSTIARWRQVDTCGPATVTIAGPVHTDTAACPASRTVRLITIDGAGHQWPGSKPSFLADSALADPPSTAINATATLWSFFATKTR